MALKYVTDTPGLKEGADRGRGGDIGYSQVDGIFWMTPQETTGYLWTGGNKRHDWQREEGGIE